MARTKMRINNTCPYCNQFTRNTFYDSVEYTITKRGLKQYFHRSCYMKNTIGAKANG